MRKNRPFINLDKIINPGAAFVFQGVTYELSPISLETFMAYMNACYDLRTDLKEKKIGIDEYSQLLFELIHSVCPSFTQEIFNKMTLAQSAAVIQLISDTVRGTELDEEEIKKKAIHLVEMTS